MDGKQGTLKGMEDIRFSRPIEQAALDLFNPLPSNWQEWLNNQRMDGHHDADIIKALNAARDTSRKTGQNVRTLEYVSRILAARKGQGDPKPEPLPAAPPTTAGILASEILDAVRDIEGRWKRAFGQYPFPKKKPGKETPRMYRDCSGAPSYHDLMDAWRAFSKQEHHNPPTWSKFATVIKTQLGWEPLDPPNPEPVVGEVGEW